MALRVGPLRPDEWHILRIAARVARVPRPIHASPGAESPATKGGLAPGWRPMRLERFLSRARGIKSRVS